MKLYHGTKEEFIPAIMINGIRPRGEEAGNWKDYPSRSDMVYLTSTYPFYFAASTAGTGRLAVIEIETDRLDQTKLFPDEDAYLGNKIRAVSDEDRKRAHRKMVEELHLHNGKWQDSLNLLGNCAYQGVIPSTAFTRICMLDYSKRPIIVSHLIQPSISSINCQLVGQHYRDWSEWLFGDRENIPVRPILIDKPKEKQQFREFWEKESNDRTGIEVMLVSKGLRTKFLDYDARREPKTDSYCVKCQKDIKPGNKYRWVHLVNGGGLVLHSEDEPRYVPDAGDLALYKIGSDCAKKLGMEWTHPGD